MLEESMEFGNTNQFIKELGKTLIIEKKLNFK